MNSKSVLKRILALLSTEEVEFTDAKDAQGQILQSPTFDLGEPVEVVHEDGTKTPAPDGEHEISLKDSEGRDVIIRVVTKDGKITERENVEEAQPEGEEEMADVKVEPIPQANGKEEKVNERPEQPNSVTSGTLKMAEEDEVAGEIPATEDKSMEEEGEAPVDMSKMMEEMSYRIEEMAKKIAAMEAMYPPVASEVVQEEEGIKMSEVEDEELPKLDGAPIDENGVKFSAETKTNYGKKVKTAQSSFLSKLYN